MVPEILIFLFEAPVSEHLLCFNKKAIIRHLFVWIRSFRQIYGRIYDVGWYGCLWGAGFLTARGIVVFFHVKKCVYFIQEGVLFFYVLDLADFYSHILYLILDKRYYITYVSTSPKSGSVIYLNFIKYVSSRSRCVRIKQIWSLAWRNIIWTTSLTLTVNSVLAHWAGPDN